jgi:hypothetical protein
LDSHRQAKAYRTPLRKNLTEPGAVATALNYERHCNTNQNASSTAIANVRYALACRYHAMESSWIAIDKLKHIGHLDRRVT